MKASRRRPCQPARIVLVVDTEHGEQRHKEFHRASKIASLMRDKGSLGRLLRAFACHSR